MTNFKGDVENSMFMYVFIVPIAVIGVFTSFLSKQNIS